MAFSFKHWKKDRILNQVGTAVSAAALTVMMLPVLPLSFLQGLSAKAKLREKKKDLEDFQLPGGDSRWLSQLEPDAALSMHSPSILTLRNALYHNTTGSSQENLLSIAHHERTYAYLVLYMNSAVPEFKHLISNYHVKGMTIFKGVELDIDLLKKQHDFIIGPLHQEVFTIAIDRLKEYSDIGLLDLLSDSSIATGPAGAAASPLTPSLTALFEHITLLTSMKLLPEIDEPKTPSEKLACWLESLPLDQLQALKLAHPHIPILATSGFNAVLLTVFEQKMLTDLIKPVMIVDTGHSSKHSL